MEAEKRLIDANALFKFLKEQRDRKTGAYSVGRNNGINVAIAAVKNEQICPTVDAVEVVHARWRWCGQDKFNDAYECSECGKIAMDDSNYCPNCGAKMDLQNITHQSQ